MIFSLKRTNGLWNIFSQLFVKWQPAKASQDNAKSKQTRFHPLTTDRERQTDHFFGKPRIDFFILIKPFYYQHWWQRFVESYFHLFGWKVDLKFVDTHSTVPQYSVIETLLPYPWKQPWRWFLGVFTSVVAHHSAPLKADWLSLDFLAYWLSLYFMALPHHVLV